MTLATRTNVTDGAKEITWAPRVPKRKIRRLYESEAKGLPDEALLDDVGISLFLRCESILTVGEAQAGNVRCPRCSGGGRSTIIQRDSHAQDEVLRCPECSWSTTWGSYLKTYQGKQLSEGRIGKYLLAYMQAYRRARSAKDKMLAIDRVIHEFHHNLVKGERLPTRAACVNLIEGKLTDVVTFLNELTYGDATAPGVKETRANWTKTLRSMSKWHPK